MTLEVAAGRPLHVALDARTRIRRAGQRVTGHVVEAVFAYDRLVIPADTPVSGHVVRLVPPSRLARLRAIWSGDFSPHRRVVLQFDALSLPDGVEMPIAAAVIGSVAHPVDSTAPAGDQANADRTRSAQGVRALTRRALTMAKDRVRAGFEMVRAPGKWGRLKALAIAELPYHPQYMDKGTLFTAQLSAPLAFGEATVTPEAPAGTAPIPGSLLTARLATELDSRTSVRGTPITAVVTAPVFSTDHRLIFPEGTRLLGEVTYTKRARRFHRNGRLRFLFERVQTPEAAAAPLLASLHEVQTGADDHVSVDDEGGTSVTNTKARFIAPALAVLALRQGDDHDYHDHDAGDISGASSSGHGGHWGLGSLIGFRISGLLLNGLSPSVGVGLTVLGVVRTVYTNVLSRGRDVDFPIDTPIQLQLAPARR
ncbi:MAG: hypothetical protein ACRD1V_09430 [Vicinamibacterales bacterium]